MRAYVTTIDGKQTRVEVADDGKCRIDGQLVHTDIRPTGQQGFAMLLDGESYFFLAKRSGNTYEVRLRGVRHLVNVETERERLLKAYSTTGSTLQKQMAIAAPMPAMVVRISVKAGDAIAPGDSLVVLEAMKMENEIRSHNAGTVKEVRVTPGQAVEKGEILLLLE